MSIRIVRFRETVTTLMSDGKEMRFKVPPI